MDFFIRYDVRLISAGGLPNEALYDSERRKTERNFNTLDEYKHRKINYFLIYCVATREER